MSLASAISRLNRRRIDMFNGSTAVLYYHRILPEHPLADPEKLVITCDEFEAHLSMIASSFQTPQLVDEVEKLRTGQRLCSRAVCITFDDGYRDNFIYALPLLEKYHIPATFFVTTRYLEGKGSFYWDRLSFNNDFAKKCAHAQTLTPIQREAYLTENDNARVTDELFVSPELLASISSNPLVEIGGHTHSHPFMSSLSDKEARDEIMRNRELIGEITQAPPRLFAYPYGTGKSFSARDKELVKACGYEAAFCTTYAQMRKGRDFFALPRIGAAQLNAEELRTLISSFLGCS